MNDPARCGGGEIWVNKGRQRLRRQVCCLEGVAKKKKAWVWLCN